MVMLPLRRIVALTLGWAILWAVAGATLSLVIGGVDPPNTDQGPLDTARTLGLVGAMCGMVFGMLLAVAERRRRVSEVRLFRAALWGVMAGAVVPLITPIHDEVVFHSAPLGTISAVVSVAGARLIRRATGQTAPTYP